MSPFTASPAKMTCPYCKANITTITQPKMGLLAWLVTGGLCIIGPALASPAALTTSRM